MEINARASESAEKIYTGAYEAGKDIEVGSYIITCTDLNAGYDSCCLDIFYSPEAYQSRNYGDGGEYHYLDLEDSYFVSMTEGRVYIFIVVKEQ